MEQPQDQPILTKEQQREREVLLLLQFFREAERTGQLFTYDDICAHFPYSKGTVGNLARNFWSWFLRNEEPRRKPYRFSCEGLLNYPGQYFVLAHRKNQGQYFWHFSEAMQRGEARLQALRQARQQAGIDQAPSSELPLVPEQEMPQLVHIAIIEDEDAADEEEEVNNMEREEEEPDDTTPSEQPTPVEIQTMMAPAEPQDHPYFVPHKTFEPPAPDQEPPNDGEQAKKEKPESGGPSDPGKTQEATHPRPFSLTVVITAAVVIVAVGLTIWWIASRWRP